MRDHLIGFLNNGKIITSIPIEGGIYDFFCYCSLFQIYHLLFIICNICSSAEGENNGVLLLCQQGIECPIKSASMERNKVAEGHINLNQYSC